MPTSPKEGDDKQQREQQEQQQQQQQGAPETQSQSQPPLISIPFDPKGSHPLMHSWTLWYDAQLAGGRRPGNWGDGIKEVFSISSVEDFWRLYNNIPHPSLLQQGCTYNLFKKGIQPKWEDPSNQKGGRWTLIVPKTKGVLDRLWLFLLLACVGQQIDDQDQISGAVVNLRKGQDKISVWTKNADNEAACLAIGNGIKKMLELPAPFPVAYVGHFQKGTKSRYEV